MTKSLLISLALSLTVHLSAFALTLHTLPNDIRLNTQKVVVIAGSIDRTVADGVAMQLAAHAGPGPVVVLIHSAGGVVQEGERIIKMLQAEQARGNKLFCVGIGYTHSMAFNIMSFCDMRYMTIGTTAVAHKVATRPSEDVRWTVKNLREMADKMERFDEPWRSKNAREMHLTPSQYDQAADDEKEWTAVELLSIRYLNGLAMLEE